MARSQGSSVLITFTLLLIGCGAAFLARQMADERSEAQSRSSETSSPLDRLLDEIG